MIKGAIATKNMTEPKITSASNIRDRVAEKIRATFLDLIPEDVFTEMVESEIRAFTQDFGATKSPLKSMIEDELRSQFRTLIKDELGKPEYQGMWGSHGLSAGGFVKQVISENIETIVQAQYSALVQEAVNRLSYALRQG